MGHSLQLKDTALQVEFLQLPQPPLGLELRLVGMRQELHWIQGHIAFIFDSRSHWGLERWLRLSERALDTFLEVRSSIPRWLKTIYVIWCPLLATMHTLHAGRTLYIINLKNSKSKKTKKQKTKKNNPLNCSQWPCTNSALTCDLLLPSRIAGIVAWVTTPLFLAWTLNWKKISESFINIPYFELGKTALRLYQNNLSVPVARGG